MKTGNPSLDSQVLCGDRCNIHRAGTKQKGTVVPLSFTSGSELNSAFQLFTATKINTWVCSPLQSITDFMHLALRC